MALSGRPPGQTSGQPPAVGATFGRYRIESRLGMGGMGVVYAATDTRLNRRVALKVISGQLAGDEQFVARFGHEAEVLTRLDSPHVIAIFDHGEVDGVPYIATQLVGGGDLGTMLRDRGPLPPAQAAAVCAQLAEALDDAHRVGVVHRDVKSSNVLVRDPDADEPFVYLCDFGIALTDSRGLTSSGGMAGSWAYISPERARGEAATPVSDVYSLGCLFWVCLTGRTPYDGTDVEMAIAHLNAPVPQVDGDDESPARAVNAVLSRAMAKKPGDRYPTAAELRADLLDLARGGPTTPVAPRPIASSPSPDPDRGRTVVRTSRSGRRYVVPALAAAVVATVVVGLTVWPGGLLDRDAEAPPGDADTGPHVAGDFDGDGLGDVLLRVYGANDGTVRNYVLASDGTALAPPTKAPVGNGLAAYGDVDGRPPAEIVEFENLLDGDKSRAVTLGSDGSRVVSKFAPSPTVGNAYPLLADTDGDGRDDLVLWYDTGADTGADIQVARSTPDGFAEPVQWYLTAEWNQFYDQLYGGDVDGDGHDDLVTHVRVPAPKGKISTQLRVLLARGTRFEPVDVRRTITTTSNLNPTGTTGDVDGDGSTEVVIYVEGHREQELRVYDAGPGSDGRLDNGRVWARDDEPEDREHRSSLLLSDVDGDGDDDLVLLRPATEDGHRIDVGLSDGSSFGPLETWAEVPCFSKKCDETVYGMSEHL